MGYFGSDWKYESWMDPPKDLLYWSEHMTDAEWDKLCKAKNRKEYLRIEDAIFDRKAGVFYGYGI
jgi:hypothetical protein